jgi:septal ring factor EnvC (AmiA/AmiB activator)
MLRREEKRAADLIDENVSFDFKKFLKNVGPAPSFSEPAGPTPECLSVDTMWAFHRNELSPSARTKVDEHVAGCDVCRELLTSYADAQPEEMPDGLFERITGRMQRFATSREKTREAGFWPALTAFARWAAVPAMAVLLAWVIYPARPYFGKKQQSVEMASSSDSLATKQDLEELRKRVEHDEQANNELQADLKVVTDKLTITQGQLKKARQEAVAQDTETTEKLTELDSSVHSELATKATTDDVKTVDTKVTNVSTDLDKTKNDLNMARSELGTLIARNHDEIDVLRRQGERDYIEFTISSKNPQKVGNVTIELKDVNAKRNRLSLVLVVEDKSIEQKNRSLNSPIFFYTSGAHIPEEIVINKASQNSISGYVSIPKANNQTN